MDIRETMQDSIAEQINAELFSAYLYLAMSNYFQNGNLHGFAKWMEKQASEELSHAMKFYHYITERGGSVKLKAVAAPLQKWESPLHVFEQVLSHEREITDKIGKLMDQAVSEKDHATAVELQWFIKEQVEEESTASAILEKIKIAGTSSQGLMFIDHELSMRA